MNDSIAYKILTRSELHDLEREGTFAGGEADRADGYIHLSTAGQLSETLDRHFADQTDLMIAAIDVESLGPSVRWEPARGGQLFPHVYGPLTLDTVLAYGPIERADDNTIKLPVAG